MWPKLGQVKFSLNFSFAANVKFILLFFFAEEASGKNKTHQTHTDGNLIGIF